ncbi:apolipoprotein C-IV [Brienomyrus brachyistius]|uniref:apolipoprotein C-IV n=1 Tax=Brienomyrus brachyistius TaxID=42636 RepID=UPI0020B3A764|nr:apolipoprotein C-IV [Brienomyrus brachyistius]
MLRSLITLTMLLLLAAQLSLSDTENGDNSEADMSETLQLLANTYRTAMTRAMDVGQTLLDFSTMYYQDHVKPTTDKYIELASDTTNSMWERISNKWKEYYDN